MKKYTREELISLCERAIVKEKEWCDRDTSHSQKNIGKIWVLLKAGCEFKISYEGSLKTNDDTIWIYITYDGFESRETDHFYMPTEKKLNENLGMDWY